MTKQIQVTWERLGLSNFEAMLANSKNCVYVHSDKHDNPCYIGKATDLAQRYKSGSHHLLKGCIQEGRLFYVGKFKEADLERYPKSPREKQKQGFTYNLLNLVEFDLISRCTDLDNHRLKLRSSIKTDKYEEEELVHKGDVPSFLIK